MCPCTPPRAPRQRLPLATANEQLWSASSHATVSPFHLACCQSHDITTCFSRNRLPVSINE